jgi:hypothetical protein
MFVQKSSIVDSQQLLNVSKRLGDTVVDPSIWPDLMDNICTAVSATGAMLLQSDVRTPDIPRTDSLADLCKVYFGDNWHTRDLRADRGVPLLLRGARIITDQDLALPSEMRASPFYNECMNAVGLQWFAGVGFYAGSALWGLTIQRSAREGAFERDDKRALALLSERLTEVATLSTAVGRIALSSAMNALNAVSQAAIAIDRLGLCWTRIQ